jgi:hypothetical protein
VSDPADINDRADAVNWRRALAAAVLLLGTYLAHHHGLNADFVRWDDPTHVTQNPAIRSLSIASLQAMFTTYIAHLYAPLTWLSYAIDYRVWGQDPVGYHLTNLLLHLANTLLVFVLVERVAVAARHPHPPSHAPRPRTRPSPSSLALALIAAALFGLHPLRVESVAWVTERKDVLFVLFYLLALLTYPPLAALGRTPDRPGKIGMARWRYLLTFLLFTAAALSKSAAVTFPVVILLGNRWLTGRWRWRETVPFFAVSAVIGLVTIVAQGSSATGTLADTTAIPPLARLGLVGYCSLFYVGKTFWPVHLSAVYPTFDEMTWTWLQTLAYPAALAAVTWLLFRVRRPVPLLWPAWLFYLVTLSPTIGLAPVGIHVVADRYCYLPFLGLATIIASVIVTAGRWLGGRWRPSAWLIAVPVAGMLALLGMRTHARTVDWTDTGTLFRSVLREDPDHWLAHIKLASWYRRTGFHEGAIIHARRAVELEPRAPISRKTLAWILLDLGEPGAAALELQQLVDHGHGDADVWQGLGEAYMDLGRWSSARRALAQALSFPGARRDEIADLIARVDRQEPRLRGIRGRP